MTTKTYNRQRGAGLLQLIGAVALIGIIATISITRMTNLGERAEETRLLEHVHALNSSVKLYLSSGGSLDHHATAQQVVAKLKTHAANGQSIAGFRGNFIDYRLNALEQSDKEAATDGELRVLWDSAAGEFKVARSGSKGIKAFEIDPSATPESLEQEERSTFFELAQNEQEEGSWVWDYDKESTVTAPSVVSVGIPNPDADIDPSAATDSKEQLLKPSVSPASGEYPLAEFGETGKSITVFNPNNDSEEISEAYVSVNGETWRAISSDATLEVPPGAVVATFASVKPEYVTNYYNSYVGSATFEGTKVTNTEPTISASSAQFHPVDQKTVAFTINHTNDPVHVKPQFQINDGSWQDYEGPVEMNIADHIDGVTVKTRAVGINWPDYYEASPENALVISTLDHVLESPTVELSESLLHPLESPSVVFTVTDPNEALGAWK